MNISNRFTTNLTLIIFYIDMAQEKVKELASLKYFVRDILGWYVHLNNNKFY